MARSDKTIVPLPSKTPRSYTTRAIILIGFMGSGKSCVARILARDLNCDAIDLDKIIEQRAGCSIATLFATEGEPAFRQLETQALREILSSTNIIATGGGVVTQPENRDLLKMAHQQGTADVVYLKAQSQTLAERIRRQPGKRPLIDGTDSSTILNMAQTQAKVEQLLAQRAQFYESCANIVISTDSLASYEVSERVRLHLSQC